MRITALASHHKESLEGSGGRLPSWGGEGCWQLLTKMALPPRLEAEMLPNASCWKYAFPLTTKTVFPDSLRPIINFTESLSCTSSQKLWKTGVFCDSKAKQGELFWLNFYLHSFLSCRTIGFKIYKIYKCHLSVLMICQMKTIDPYELVIHMLCVHAKSSKWCWLYLESDIHKLLLLVSFHKIWLTE